MADLTILRREIRMWNTLAFSIYDQFEEGDSLTNKLALRHDNTQTRANPVRLQQNFFFPEVYEWLDEVLSMEGMDRLTWSVPLKEYAADIPYRTIDIGRPEVVASLADVIPRVPQAWTRHYLRLAMDVFRTDATCYDGENFFSASHQNPGFGAGGGTFDNTLAPNWSDPADPTITEAEEALRDAFLRLHTNTVIQAEATNAKVFRENMIVIVHNDTHLRTFTRLQEKERIGTNMEENDLRGTFELYRDHRPTSGQENRIEVIHGAGAPPAVITMDKMPSTLDAFETMRYGTGYVGVGWKGILGSAALFPQSAVQIRPT